MGEGTQGRWLQDEDSGVGLYISQEDLLPGDSGDIVCEPPGEDCEDSYRRWSANASNIAYRHNTWAAEVELVKGLLHIAESHPSVSLREPVRKALQSWLTADKARYEEVYGEG